MQEGSHFPRRAGLLALLALLVLSAVLLPIASSPVQAQISPTATPTDQLWLAFSAARTALQNKFHTDLTIVQNWKWTQDNWTGGIDDCVTKPASPRQLFFGWTFLITSMDGHQYEGRSSFDHTIVTACDTVTASAAAPTAAPAASGSLPAPVAGSAASGGFQLGGQVTSGIGSNNVPFMQRAGMTWVKVQYVYELGQDPSAVTSIVSSAHANGLKVLISLVGDPSQMGDYNSYIGSFAGFAAGIAGENADAIEVWNESNINREWPQGQISGATYTQLLAATYNAIKSKNGNVMVISGAPSPTGAEAAFPGQVENDDHWLRDLVGAGGLNYLDCVGVHYNDGAVPPTASSGAPVGSSSSYTWYLPGMLSTYQGITGGQKPICFTELGYLSMEGINQSLVSNFSWAANTSVAEQASWLAGAATENSQNGGVRLMIVWNVDSNVFTSTDPQGGYAMHRPDGSCPACDALGAVMK